MVVTRLGIRRGDTQIWMVMGLAGLLALFVFSTALAGDDGGSGDPKYNIVPVDTTKTTAVTAISMPSYSHTSYIRPKETRMFHSANTLRSLWMRLSLLYWIKQ